jgi:hypothetical protein
MSELREVWAVFRYYDEEMDDTQGYIVAIYPGEKEARQHVELARKAIPKKKRYGWGKWRSPYDPELRLSLFSRDIVRYSVEKAPFALHVDQFLERVPE